MDDNNNKPLANVRGHTTHFACQERLDKYGGKTVGCCCTGHDCYRGRPMVAGEPAAERLIKQVKVQYGYHLKSSDGGVVNPLQIATVLHAMADHTAIMEALKHRPDPTSPWPEATSIGRWLHDVADDLEANHG